MAGTDARIGGQTGWWSRALPGVLPDLGTLAGYEADARAITDWSVSLIPGLLQTRDYAVAFMVADDVASQDIEARWTARQRRQKVLPNVDYTAFLHENALRVPFGGRASFKQQLEHLYGAYDRGLGIRIVRGAHASLVHSWMLIEFPHASPILHVELQRSGVFLYDDEVEPYEQIRARMGQEALTGADSRRAIARILERL